MKNIIKKLLLSFCAVSILSFPTITVSNATIYWDSYAYWTGYGGQATAHAITKQQNEPAFYKITVEAGFNDGSYRYKDKNPAYASDEVRVDFTSDGAVSSGSSFHEWIMVGESAAVREDMPIY